MISVSDKALRQIKNIMKDENKESWSLRIGVKGGGCSGFSYIMQFDRQPAENDHVVTFSGVDILVDTRSADYLKGTEVDYADGLNGAGFVFNNPNATRSCGCGNSFSA